MVIIARIGPHKVLAHLPLNLFKKAVMFDRLSLLSADPILGLIGQFTADSNPNKIDLGVGVYRDAQGHTPILATVKKAESILWEVYIHIAAPHVVEQLVAGVNAFLVGKKEF